MIQKEIVGQLNAENDSLHMADGFSLPVCKFKRAYFSRIFKGFAAYGCCVSKAETYYGFKGNLAINSVGAISNITLQIVSLERCYLIQSLFLLIK